jgi:tight adherence protein B
MNLQALFAEGTLTPQTMMLLALPIFAGFILILLALATGGGKEKQFKDRVELVKTGRRKKVVENSKISAKRSLSDSENPFIDQLIKSALPKREQLRLRLRRAGIEAPLGRYLAVSVIVGLGAMATSLMLKFVPPVAAVFVGIIAGVALPHMVIGAMGTRRQNKFVEYFPDAIDLMVRGLKSGLPIGESIKTAGNEVPDPVGVELRRVTDAVRMGTKLEDALWETANRIDIQDFKFFTVSLAIQSETGGNLSETLGNLSNVLRGRRQLKLKIKAMSSEAKASAYIIGSLPFVVGFFIYLVNRSYVMKLFLDERGNVMLGIGGLMFLVGGVVMYKMVKFEI